MMPSDISDHNMVVTSIKTIQPTRTKGVVTRSYLDHSKLSIAFHYEEDDNSDVNQCAERLLQTIKQAVSNATMTKSFKIKNITNIQPWFNLKVLSLMHEKDALWNKIRVLRKSKQQPSAELAKDYRTKVVTFQTELQSSKRRYYEKMFTDADTNITWKMINSVLGKVKEDKHISLKNNGLLITEPVAVANLFANFFAEKPLELLSRIKIPSPDDADKFRTLPKSHNSIYLYPTTTDEVEKAINEMGSNKTAGYDGIKADVVKTLVKKISQPITNIINNIMSAGVFPECLKIGVISPVHKGGDKSDIDNYRPITVTSAVSKPIESILHERFKDFAIRNKLFSPIQYGFGNGCGTEPAIIDLVHDIRCLVGPKTQVAVVFIDLTAAFDTIVHQILLLKADRYGYRGNAHNLLESFLSNWKNVVKVSEAKSELKVAPIGAPQGCSFSVFSFILAIDDVAKLPLKGRIKLYIDDIALVYAVSDKISLELVVDHDMKIITDFLSINRLTLSIRKTKFMIFHSQYDKPLYPEELKLSSITISRVYQYKYLGVIMDPVLSWNNHIDKLRGNLLPVTTALWKLHYILPTKILRQVYFAHFQSRLNYMVSTWGTANQAKIHSIQALQNRALKSVHKLPKLHSTSDIYLTVEPKVLPVRGLYTHNLCLFIRRSLSDLIRHQLPLVVKSNRLRSNGQIMESSAKSLFARKDICSNGVAMYNKLPNEIKQCPVSRFKFLLNRYLNDVNLIEKFLNCDIWNIL